MEESTTIMETETQNSTENEENNKIQRNLMAVLFPGIVKNDQKAIDYLGGIKSISQVCKDGSCNCYLPFLLLVLVHNRTK